MERKLSERVDQSVLKGNGHVVRMQEELLTNRVWRADASGVKLKEMDGWGCESIGSERFFATARKGECE